MLRKIALALGTAATVLGVATPALAWPVNVRVNFGAVMPVAQIGPIAIGGTLVQSGVLLRPDGLIAVRASFGAPEVPAYYGPCQQLVVYQPDGVVRTIVVRDADRPVFERYLWDHHERFFWRSYAPPIYVQRQIVVRRDDDRWRRDDAGWQRGAGGWRQGDDHRDGGYEHTVYRGDGGGWHRDGWGR